MKFKLEFSMDNAAFEDKEEEIKRILDLLSPVEVCYPGEPDSQVRATKWRETCKGILEGKVDRKTRLPYVNMGGETK